LNKRVLYVTHYPNAYHYHVLSPTSKTSKVLIHSPLIRGAFHLSKGANPPCRSPPLKLSNVISLHPTTMNDSRRSLGCASCLLTQGGKLIIWRQKRYSPFYRGNQNYERGIIILYMLSKITKVSQEGNSGKG
jgi:hypothetical protein